MNVSSSQSPPFPVKKVKSKSMKGTMAKSLSAKSLSAKSLSLDVPNADGPSDLSDSTVQPLPLSSPSNLTATLNKNNRYSIGPMGHIIQEQDLLASGHGDNSTDSPRGSGSLLPRSPSAASVGSTTTRLSVANAIQSGVTNIPRDTGIDSNTGNAIASEVLTADNLKKKLSLAVPGQLIPGLNLAGCAGVPVLQSPTHIGGPVSPRGPSVTGVTALHSEDPNHNHTNDDVIRLSLTQAQQNQGANTTTNASHQGNNPGSLSGSRRSMSSLRNEMDGIIGPNAASATVTSGTTAQNASACHTPVLTPRDSHNHLHVLSEDHHRDPHLNSDLNHHHYHHIVSHNHSSSHNYFNKTPSRSSSMLMTEGPTGLVATLSPRDHHHSSRESHTSDTFGRHSTINSNPRGSHTHHHDPLARASSGGDLDNNFGNFDEHIDPNDAGGTVMDECIPEVDNENEGYDNIVEEEHDLTKALSEKAAAGALEEGVRRKTIGNKSKVQKTVSLDPTIPIADDEENLKFVSSEGVVQSPLGFVSTNTIKNAVRISLGEAQCESPSGVSDIKSIASFTSSSNTTPIQTQKSLGLDWSLYDTDGPDDALFLSDGHNSINYKWAPSKDASLQTIALNVEAMWKRGFKTHAIDTVSKRFSFGGGGPGGRKSSGRFSTIMNDSETVWGRRSISSSIGVVSDHTTSKSTRSNGRKNSFLLKSINTNAPADQFAYLDFHFDSSESYNGLVAGKNYELEKQHRRWRQIITRKIMLHKGILKTSDSNNSGPGQNLDSESKLPSDDLTESHRNSLVATSKPINLVTLSDNHAAEPTLGNLLISKSSNADLNLFGAHAIRSPAARALNRYYHAIHGEKNLLDNMSSKTDCENNNITTSSDKFHLNHESNLNLSPKFLGKTAYVGEWLLWCFDGLGLKNQWFRHGVGLMTYGDGGSYLGNFRKDKREGKGVYRSGLKLEDLLLKVLDEVTNNNHRLDSVDEEDDGNNNTLLSSDDIIEVKKKSSTIIGLDEVPDSPIPPVRRPSDNSEGPNHNLNVKNIKTQPIKKSSHWHDRPIHSLLRLPPEELRDVIMSRHSTCNDIKNSSLQAAEPGLFLNTTGAKGALLTVLLHAYAKSYRARRQAEKWYSGEEESENNGGLQIFGEDNYHGTSDVTSNLVGNTTNLNHVAVTNASLNSGQNGTVVGSASGAISFGAKQSNNNSNVTNKPSGTISFNSNNPNFGRTPDDPILQIISKKSSQLTNLGNGGSCHDNIDNHTGSQTANFGGHDTSVTNLSDDEDDFHHNDINSINNYTSTMNFSNVSVTF